MALMRRGVNRGSGAGRVSVLSVVGLLSAVFVLAVVDHDPQRVSPPSREVPAGNIGGEGDGAGSPRTVSMVAILADPEGFHGKQVRFTGFVSVMEDMAVVGFNREALAYSIPENCIYIDLSRVPDAEVFLERANTKCSVLTGVIDSFRGGPEGWGDFYACTLRLTGYSVQTAVAP